MKRRPNPNRPIAGSPQRKGRYPRPARPVEPSPSTPPAHAASAPAKPRKRPPRLTAVPPAEPAQQEGATLPTVRREGACLLACVDGLRGVVSRWSASASRLGDLVSFTRLSGAVAPQHAATVERHRERVEEWMRGQRARA